MQQVSCDCGIVFNDSKGPRFCTQCGAQLPPRPEDLEADLLHRVYQALLAFLALRPHLKVAVSEDQSAWTRCEPARGYAVLAWFDSSTEGTGVHAVEMTTLRHRGVLTISTAVRGERFIIESDADIAEVFPRLFGN